MIEQNTKQLDSIAKKLDLIAIILLAQHGLTLKEIGKILGTSDTTVKRMLAGNFNKIQGSKNGK